MRQIPPYSIWIGHAGDGTNYRQLLDLGIAAIVQVAEEEPALQPPRELIYCRFPLIDGGGNDRKLLYLTITTLANLLEKNVPTLVCCSGGMSRSPAITAAALSMVYQQEPDESLKEVAEHHPADVLPGLWKEVTAFLDADRY
jgi:protein-tyrosine phosphatase